MIHSNSLFRDFVQSHTFERDLFPVSLRTVVARDTSLCSVAVVALVQQPWDEERAFGWFGSAVLGSLDLVAFVRHAKRLEGEYVMNDQFGE